MRALIGCEESQTICKEFRARGHEAYSCDLEECSGGHPEWHLKMNVFEAIYLMKWDIIILHPPCTAIAVSGNGTYAGTEERMTAATWAQELFKQATNVCDKVAMENPVGVLNSLFPWLPKPQYIQPWQFGHGETKRTGLWLYGLPELKPTNIVTGRDQKVWKMPPSADRAKLRSKTYEGIAKAIVDQWT